MSIIDTVFLICATIVSVFILAIRMVEWIRDTKLKRQMRAAGVSEENIKETFRIVDLGRNRARRAPGLNGLPGLNTAYRRNKTAWPTPP